MKTQEVIFVTVVSIALGAGVMGSYCAWPRRTAACYLSSNGADLPELPHTYSPTHILDPGIVMSGTANASVSPSPSFEIPIQG